MITFTLGGSTKQTDSFLRTMQQPSALYSDLAGIAQRGVMALQAATPKDSGQTAMSWGYEITIKNGGCTISWLNRNKAGEVSVAILLQYGHGTGTGGYVAGQDYINPALKPVFDDIANNVWKKVTSA